MKKIFIAVLFTSFQSVFSQSLQLKITQDEIPSSLRGLSVVNDSVAWVSGSNGWYGVSVDGGERWNFRQVKGFENLDFRSLYAFDDQTAIIVNAGSPAFILRTKDGGENWKEVYRNNNSQIFIDGIDFWDENEGLIYGDPIQGKMLLLKTTDRGCHWSMLPDESRPELAEGEASFAASGTGIRCLEKDSVWVATGGIVSRLWLSTNRGLQWEAIAVPIIQGKSTTGIFSVACSKTHKMVVVGGDYTMDSIRLNHVLNSADGLHWEKPATETRGYRECVEYLEDNTIFAIGPTGIDVSTDGGINWLPFSDEKLFHVIRKARNGTRLLVAGKGKTGIINKQ